MRPRRGGVDALLAVGIVAVATVAMRRLLVVGSCQTPAGDGLPECPPGTLWYGWSMVAVTAAVVYGVLGRGAWAAFYAAFLGIGLGGLLAGLSDGGESWHVAFGLGFLLLPAAPLLVVPFAVRQRRAARALVAGGVRGVATVESVADTGVTVNNDIRVRLALRVESAVTAPFTVTGARLVSRVDVPRPGDRFTVWFDPHDPARWTWDPDGRAALAEGSA